METSKVTTSAVHMPASQVGGRDSTAFDAMQIGLGAGGLAILLGAAALTKRAAQTWKQRRATDALRAQEQLQAAVCSAVAARMEEFQQALPKAPPVPEQPEQPEPAPQAEADSAQARQQGVDVATQQTCSPDVPVLSEIVTPAVDSRKSDPKYIAARRLLDALHTAERDVEPFLQFVATDNGAIDQGKHDSARDIIISWHQAVQRSRNALQEVFSRNNLLDDLPSTPAPRNMGEALERLYHHAAFFTSMLTVQQRHKSPILTWSKQLPGAVLQLYWHAHTHALSADMQANPLPLLPEGPAPGRVPVKTAPATDSRDYQDLLKRAIGGGNVAG
jgi:hypothetical protein